MKKEFYTAPEMEVIAFDAEDVITTSLIDGGYGVEPTSEDVSDLFQ